MKKVFLLSVLIFTFLILPGCGNQENSNGTISQQEVNQNEQIENNTSDYSDEAEQKDKAALDKALSGDLNISDCNNISDINMKNFCIKDIITTQAIQNNDMTKCDSLSIDEDREYCRNKF